MSLSSYQILFRSNNVIGTHKCKPGVPLGQSHHRAFLAVDFVHFFSDRCLTKKSQFKRIDALILLVASIHPSINRTILNMRIALSLLLHALVSHSLAAEPRDDGKSSLNRDGSRRRRRSFRGAVDAPLPFERRLPSEKVCSPTSCSGNNFCCPGLTCVGTGGSAYCAGPTASPTAVSSPLTAGT